MKRNKLEVLIAHLVEAGFELVELREEKVEESNKLHKTGRIELLVEEKSKS